MLNRKFIGFLFILLGASQAVQMLDTAASAQAKPAVNAPAAWPKSGHELQNSSRGGGPGAQGKLLWRVKTGGPFVDSRPIVGLGGVVYIGSRQNTVLALDGQTGQPLPSFQFESNPQDALPPINGYAHSGYNAPAQSSDGTLYVSSDDFNIYAFDGQTGRKKWQFAATLWCYSSPTFSPDGKLVYAGCEDWEVYALDRQTGRKVWGFRSAPIDGTPAVGSDGTVYVCSMDGNVYALNGKTGKKLWVFHSSDIFHSTPCLSSKGMLYVANKGGRVYGLDSRTGKEKWSFKLKGPIFSTPALGPNDTVYEAADKFYALDAHTGRPKWAYPVNSDSGSCAIAADGTVYVGSTDYNLYAIDGRSGKLRWTFKTGGNLDSSPAIGADGTVYFGSEDGYLYAVH